MNNKAFKNITQFVCFIMSFMMVQNLDATHIVGGDLSYRCIVGDTYEITLTMRRDCEFGADDAPFDDPASIGIYDTFGTLQVLLGANGQLLLPFMGADTIETNIDGCGPTGMVACVHEAVYRGTVQIPQSLINSNPNGFILAYQRCCRNQTLDNIIDPLMNGSTYFVHLTTKAMRACNSGATFDNWPDIHICVNENLAFDHGATDADGDSLVYKLCNPLNGASFDEPFPQPPAGPPYVDLAFEQGFSVSNFLGGANPLTINPNTGLITATPGIIGQFLVGVCVEEYRDGELISTTMRDFEYNVVPCSETVQASFEYTQEDCAIPMIDFTGISDLADQFEWCFDYPNTDPTLLSSEQNPSFDYSAFAENSYVVKLEATRSQDGCSDIYFDTVYVSREQIMADFVLETVECISQNEITIYLEDVSDHGITPLENNYWLITNASGTDTLSGDTVITTVNNSAFNIELVLKYVNGCEARQSLNVLEGELLPNLKIFANLQDCSDDNKFITHFTPGFEGGFLPDDVEIVSYNWNIDKDSGNLTGMDSVLVYDVNDGEGVWVDLELSYDNGCSSVARVRFEYEDLFGGISYQASLSSCDTTNSEVLLDGELVLPNGGNWDEAQWEITINQNTNSFTGDSILLNLNPTDEVLVHYFVSNDNNCLIELRDTLDLTTLFPSLNIIAEKNDCQSDTIGYSFSTDLNTSLQATSFDWSYTLNGNPMNSALMFFDLDLEKGDVIVANLEVAFENGCSYAAETLTLNVEGFDPELSADTISSCELDTINIFNNFDSNWNINITPDINILNDYNGNGPAVISLENQDYTILIDDGICEAQLALAVVANGQSNIDLALDKNGCNPDGTIQYNITTTATNPISNYEWTYQIDGAAMTSDEAQLTLDLLEGNNLEISLVVVFEDGCTGSSDVIMELVTAEVPPLEILGDTLICDNQVALTVGGQTSNIQFEWAEDAGFINIISGASQSLVFDLDASVQTKTFYFRVVQSDDPCYNGYEDEVTVTNHSFDIEYASPFTMCVGDTTSMTVFNLDPSQNLTFTWNDPHVVDQDGSGRVTIGLGSVEEDFGIPFVVTNQFGCERFDTIDIVIGQGVMLDFTYSLDSCDGYTMCFVADTSMAGIPLWEFGDPNTTNDVATNDLQPCYTYPGPGEYIVTFQEINAVCGGIPIQKTIIVPEILELSSDLDTIIYFPNSIITLEATTSANPDSIVWCLEDQTVIGMGSNIDYAPVGALTIFAKIDNGAGCTDSISIYVEPIGFFTGIDLQVESDVVCPDEPFQLEVVSDRDLSGFTFEWLPSECIVEGANEAIATALIQDSKTISVKLTDNVNGVDTIFSSFIEIGDPQVNIQIDHSSLDLLYGQEYMLFVTDPMDGYTYEWSDGQLGQEVLISPSETGSYEVTATDENGCTAVASIDLNVTQPQCTEDDVFLPNAFSPNGDGNNDLFRVRSNFVEEMKLIIYNRWGEEIFISEDLNIGWDGTYEGKQLPPDVFAFYVEAVCINGVQYQKQGNVSLIR